MKISTVKTEVLHFSRNPDQCVLQVKGATLKQVEKFKYLGVTLASDGRQDEELDVRIGKAIAVMRALHYSVVMKREWSKKAKLSIFKAVLSPFSLMIMNLEQCKKSAISSVNVLNESFTKNRRSYTV